MAKRFSRLKYALTTLRNATTEGKPGLPPAGTVLEKYYQVHTKARKPTYARDTESLPKKILKVTIVPFFFGGDVTNKVIVSQSKRASDSTNTTAIKTACNQIAVDFETDKVLKGFTPAKVTAFRSIGTTSNPDSQITGIKYVKKNGESYTFPYGASVTEKAEGKVRADILAAVPATSTILLSFTSEKY